MTDAKAPDAVFVVHRDETGKMLPGSTANPRGRPRGGKPPLPDWLKADGEEALRYIAAVAKGEEFAEPALRLKAAEVIVTRVYGPVRYEPDTGAPLVDRLEAVAALLRGDD